MSLNKQTNTRSGPLPFTAGDDIIEARGVTLTHSGGSARVELAESTDRLFGIVGEGADAGNDGQIYPLNPDRNVRVTLKGTCNPGDPLVLADHSVAADKGKFRTVPTDPGTYTAWLIAEQSGVDGQDVLARPISREEVEVEA